MPNLEGMLCKYLYLNTYMSTLDELVGKMPGANLHMVFMFMFYFSMFCPEDSERLFKLEGWIVFT